MSDFVFDFAKVESMLRNNEAVTDSLKNDGRPIFVYGFGIYAKGLCKYLDKLGIDVKGFVVDDAYLTAEHGNNVLALSEAVAKGNLILLFGIGGGFTDWYFKKVSELNSLISSCTNSKFIVLNDYWLAEEGFINHEILDVDYIKENLDSFKTSYDLLEDDLSKKTMLGFMYASAGKDASGYPELATDTEHDYNLELLFEGRDNGTVVECGAFDGESIVQMSDYSNNRFDMIALECDEVNYVKCLDAVKDYPNIRVVKLGVWDKKAKLALIMSDSSSYLKEVNDYDNVSDAVEVTDLDSLITCENVAAIVMDIEGSELKALMGARHLIENGANLAVRIYHKKEDFIKIPQFIYGINKDYKFYIRYNRKAGLCRTCDETTLYAIKR